MAERDTWLAVLPIGYGDGWRRGCSNNADVLIAGRRCPVVGTVSMDNLTVDLGPDAAERAARRGGDPDRGAPTPRRQRQGAERITAEEVARRLGTINYEVTCALTPRVPRLYHRDGEPQDPAERRDWTDRPGPRRSIAARPAMAEVARARRRRLVAARARSRLGRPLTDLDLVVDGDPEQAARAIARAAGRAACFALSEDFGAWRVVARDRSVAGGYRAAARRLVAGGPASCATSP